MRTLFFNILSIASLLVVLCVSESKATHLYGGSIRASCQNACVYTVYMENYWDCGIQASIQPAVIPNAPIVNFQGIGTGCTGQPTGIGSWVLESAFEVTPICPTSTTRCTNSNSTISGVMQVVYTRDYNFCVASACPQYEASWASCCRVNTLTSGAAAQGFYAETLIDLSTTPCNHAPEFTQPSLVTICASDTSHISQAAFDLDGDSLNYSLINCRSSSSMNVTYNAGYSFLSPLGADWQVILNSQTGMMDFIPSSSTLVSAPICIRVDEFRNGNLIGTVMRDMMLSVINCNGSNAQPTVDSSALVAGGFQRGPANYRMTQNDSLRLKFWVSDLNLTQQLDVDFPQAGGTFSKQVMGTNPAEITISFRPTRQGYQQFALVFKDNACPTVGSTSYPMGVTVIGPSVPPVQDSIVSDDVFASIWSDGTLFWTPDSTPGLAIPRDSGINMAQAAGLWIGGRDATGNLRLSAHGQDKLDKQVSDFWAGPLTPNAAQTDITTVTNYNRIWQVDQQEIEDFLTDFNDNGIVDFPQNYPNVYGWPAFGLNAAGGNVTATAPDGSTIYMAPFVDVNGDPTDYDPSQGDYPAIKGDRMYWWIYNDQSPSHDPTAGSLGIEIHASAFVFDCPDSLDKNNTIFFDYTLINRSNAQINDTYIGFWTDGDVGFAQDDYVAVDSIRNLYFFYNSDSWDENNFGVSPPALGVGILEGPLADPADGIDNDKDGVTDEVGETWNMNGFIAFEKNNNGINGIPTEAIHYDRYLRSFWQDSQALVDNYRDGQGMGNGIPASAAGDPTSYLFSGSPCEGIGWTEKNSAIPGSDRQGVGRIGPLGLSPGAVKQFSMHYSFAREFYSDEIGSTCEVIKKQLELSQFAQSDYENCGYYDPPVHPGDANFDQVANNLDLLAIGLNFGKTGPNRILPTNQWVPQNALPWGDTLANGADLKHSDCDGTGVIDTFDIAPILSNYGSTHTYTKNEGSGAPLFLLSPTTTFNAGDTARIPIHWGDMNDSLADAYGIAFSLSYDSSKVDEAWVEYNNSWLATPGSDMVALHKDLRDAEKIDIGISRNNQMNRAGYGRIADLIIVMDDDLHKRVEPMTIGVSGVYAINKEEEEIPVVGIDGQINLETSLENQLSNRVSLFPNPTQDRLYLGGIPRAEIQQITLYDMRGKSQAVNISEQQRRFYISLDHLMPGFYVLEIQTASEKAAFKVIKQP